MWQDERFLILFFWKGFRCVWDTIEDIGFGNVSEKFLPSNLKAKLKIFIFWNIKPILFLMFS